MLKDVGVHITTEVQDIRAISDTPIPGSIVTYTTNIKSVELTELQTGMYETIGNKTEADILFYRRILRKSPEETSDRLGVTTRKIKRVLGNSKKYGKLV